MKEAGAIRHKVKQVRYRHLKKLLHRDLKRCASNCRFNRTMMLPNGEQVGTCGFQWADDDAWPGVCDESHHDYAVDFPNEEGGCPKFAPHQEKDEIKAAFRDWLADATLPQIAVRYPDLAALLWVLEGDAPDREAKIPEDGDFQAEVHRVLVAGVEVLVPTAAHAKQVEKHIDDLVAAVVDMEKEIQDAASHALELEEELDDTESDLEERTAELATAVEHISKIEEENAALRRDHKHASEKLIELRDELKHASEKLIELRDELNEATGKLTQPKPSWWQRFLERFW